jgi:transposase
MGDLFDLERGQIVGACAAGASVTETAALIAVSRATVSKVMSAYTNHGKTTSSKRSSGSKSTLTERDHCILRTVVSKNHRTTAAQVTEELNIQLEDRFHKNCRRELDKANIHGTAAIHKPLITESNAQMRK